MASIINCSRTGASKYASLTVIFRRIGSRSEVPVIRSGRILINAPQCFTLLRQAKAETTPPVWLIDTTVRIRRMRDHGTIPHHTTNQYPGFYSGKQDCGYPVSRLCVTNGVGAKHRIKIQVGNTSERPAQSGDFGLSTRTSAVQGTSLAGSCKQTSYIPLCNKSPYHRPHRTSSREKASRTSHNATPARPVMAIKKHRHILNVRVGLFRIQHHTVRLLLLTQGM